MRILDSKLLRDLYALRSQVITIALVVASGIGAFIATLSTYDSLQWSRATYYDSSRFADVFADLKRAPKPLERQLAEISGVADVETTVIADVNLDLPGVAEPVIGRMIGLPPDGLPRINRLTLRHGRFVDTGHPGEALVSDAFAKARNLRPGDQVAAILNGKRETFRIVGVVLSPEYIFSTRGSALPDDKGFGVFWVNGKRLASAFDMDGAFNHAALRLASGARKQAVVEAVDRVLEPYGGLLAHDRSEQISNRILSQEIDQQKTMATVFPVIFLGVAAFLLNVVLTRQVAAQRDQIASLKALGYGNGAIAGHYLKFIVLIVAIGIVLGIALGTWLGYKMTAMYTMFFHFPRLAYRVQPWIPLVASTVSLAAGLGGGLGTVLKVARLAPAEAMRPPAPVKFRRMFLERLGLAHLLSPQARMVIRIMERRPLRVLLTAFGIACAVATIVSSTFWRDAIDFLIAVQFNTVERENASIVFAQPVNASALHEIEHMPGVIQAEPSRSVPIRLVTAHRSYRTAVLGLPDNSRLRQLLDARQQEVHLPPDGILLSKRLAERLQIRPGERVELEALEGRRNKRPVTVAGLVDDMLGLNAYMGIGALNRLMGEGDSISSVIVLVDSKHAEAFYRRLKEIPKVATVSVKSAALQSFRETSARNILFFTAIVTGFAGAIATGVVYNSARIALSERAWELASLRVLGFTRREVSTLLLSELAVELAAAIPLGLWFGYLLALLIAALTHTETVAIPVIIWPRTYAYAAVAILAAAAVSALIVRRRVDRLDLVAVLKTRE